MAIQSEHVAVVSGQTDRQTDKQRQSRIHNNTTHNVTPCKTTCPLVIPTTRGGVINATRARCDRVERASIKLDTARETSVVSQNATESLVAASRERKSRGSGRTTVDWLPAQRHGCRTTIHYLSTSAATAAAAAAAEVGPRDSSSSSSSSLISFEAHRNTVVTNGAWHSKPRRTPHCRCCHLVVPGSCH